LERYVCIHGHFYQPPRENPWLEAIEIQDSAYPYHDWNERITAECYEPNARARILDDDGWIVRIVNNYSRISFNVGPTLLSWMEENTPEAYRAILEADRQSMERFSGHGSAMAQGWGHIILPLSNQRDRRTQVKWGVRDFERRFGRKPEGMWLPETAVNTETLEALAEHGLKFTVLAPRQAWRIRPISQSEDEAQEWEEVGERIDPTRAYRCNLPSGRRVVLFFYDGPISQAVAFERLLERGEYLAGRLLGAFSEERKWPQLVHIATDGETYGHHHRHGEMALAYALEQIDSAEGVRLTNYGEYLEKHPPTHEVEIAENTSWSCYHGVERWRSNCGCSTGGNLGWNQEWRAPLREALDWLRNTLAPLYEQHAGALLKDPWAARDEYIQVLLERTPANAERFLAQHAREPLDEAGRVRALRLLEMQRHALLMYTSCGWFFDELSGIETAQVIFYAGRAIQLAHKALGVELEEEFLTRLEKAKSNIPARRDGRRIYEEFVRPAFVDLLNVGAHYAISSLFEEFEERARIFCYDVETGDLRRRSAGRAQLRIGRATVTSRVTLNTEELAFAALHLGDHIMNGGVQAHVSDEHYGELVRTAEEAFDRADFTEVLRLMNEAFGESNYTIRSLFRDEQHKVMRLVLAPTLSAMDEQYRQIYEQHAALIRFLASAALPVPRRLHTPANFVLNAVFRAAAEAEPPDVERMRATVEEARQVGITLDQLTLSWVLEQTLERLARTWAMQPRDIEHVVLLEQVVQVVGDLPFEVNLAEAQNVFYGLLQEVRPGVLQAAESGDGDARRWVSAFDSLGQQLRVRVM
jgi:alpha-amylase/alpha-mannosidase (GH57 family)